MSSSRKNYQSDPIHGVESLMNVSVAGLLPAIAAFCFIFPTIPVSGAEPVEVLIEAVRFDCSKCPDVYDRYDRYVSCQQSPKMDLAAVNLAMQAVEKAAVKHLQFRHVQVIELHSRIRQTTQTHDSTVALDLHVRSADRKSFTVEFDAKFTQRREGVEHESQQTWGTTWTCALGETSWVSGWGSRRQSPGKPTKLEVCAVRVGVNKIDSGELAQPDSSEGHP